MFSSSCIKVSPCHAWHLRHKPCWLQYKNDFGECISLWSIYYLCFCYSNLEFLVLDKFLEHFPRSELSSLEPQVVTGLKIYEYLGMRGTDTDWLKVTHQKPTSMAWVWWIFLNTWLPVTPPHFTSTYYHHHHRCNNMSRTKHEPSTWQWKGGRGWEVQDTSTTQQWGWEWAIKPIPIKGSNQVAGKEKPLLCQKTQIDLTRRVSLYAVSKNMTWYDWEGFPSCYIENYGICGPNLHGFWYPYPHSSKPISVNMGTGFKQVWMWVLIELPMDYL